MIFDLIERECIERTRRALTHAQAQQQKENESNVTVLPYDQ